MGRNRKDKSFHFRRSAIRFRDDGIISRLLSDWQSPPIYLNVFTKYKFRLFITGYTSHSQRAIENLRDICDASTKNEYEVEVIDTLEHPELAENARITAMPTLIRMFPSPNRRIIGDLSQKIRYYVL